VFTVSKNTMRPPAPLQGCWLALWLCWLAVLQTWFFWYVVYQLAWFFDRAYLMATVQLWFALELAFWLHSWITVTQLECRSKPPAYDETPDQMLDLMFGTLDSLAVPYETFIRRWFLDTPLSRIKRGNVEQFVAWGFFAREAHDLTDAQHQQVAGLVRAIEERMSRRGDSSSGSGGSSGSGATASSPSSPPPHQFEDGFDPTGICNCLPSTVCPQLKLLGV
jgi:hypothetical protein